MNIVLIGMRGSGKTSVAKKLAKKLDKKFLDMDDLLSQKVNMSLPEFVKKFGWDLFRDKESELTNELQDTTNAVISTGGGIILRSQNSKALKKNGKFIFLKTSVDSMLKRLEGDRSRPALTDKRTLKEELEHVWEERKTLYENAADIIIETDNKTIEEIAEKIISKLN